VGTHQGNELARNFHGTLVRSLASSLYHSRLLLGLQEWHYRACADIHRKTKASKQTNKQKQKQQQQQKRGREWVAESSSIILALEENATREKNNVHYGTAAINKEIAEELLLFL